MSFLLNGEEEGMAVEEAKLRLALLELIVLLLYVVDVAVGCGVGAILVSSLLSDTVRL